MALHDRLLIELHTYVERLLERYDDLRKYLVGAEALEVSDPHRWRFAVLESRGAAVVGAMAELEASTRAFIQLTHEELNDMLIPIHELRPSLRALAAHSEMESLRNTSDNATLWERKRFTTTLDACATPSKLPVMKRTSQPPLDGKTLKPSHFHLLWQVYGLPDIAFPAISWEGSLQKMAFCRNDIAHGNYKFQEIFMQPGRETRDIERYLDDLSSFAIHFLGQWETYLKGQLYLSGKP